MLTRRRLRVGFAALLLCSAALFVGMNLSAATAEEEDPYAAFERQADRPAGEREAMAPPRDGVTVVTSHLKGAGDIVALHPNGTVLYHDDAHDGYWDVDPSPEGEDTVLYTATDEIRNESACTPVDDGEYCIRQSIERTNLSTGETEVLYSRVDGRYHYSEWHDADRINATHYVVADMYNDAVFVVNVETGVVVWEWNLQSYLPLDSGGPYPEDWAHLNDVEVLEDGRIMVSLRNHDQVVFLDRSSGAVEENWTLGSDDAHDVLYEQHNPDYIPAENGGPAVLVADSENNRIVEYQRTASGDWEQSWTWADSRLQWARDADRLPNGNTLITDTHGGRVFEVNPAGEVVWTLEVPTAYEAERLGTGDESTGGPSADEAGLASQRKSAQQDAADRGMLYGVATFVGGLLPSKVLNAVSYVLPFWMGFVDLLVALVVVGTLMVWLALEAKWSPYTLQSPVERLEER